MGVRTARIERGATIGDRDVNSTRIRELLTLGEIEEAGALLGRPFCVRGEVIEGAGEVVQGRGRNY